MNSRPLARLSIEELEREGLKDGATTEKLDAIATELQHRSSKRARSLLKRLVQGRPTKDLRSIAPTKESPQTQESVSTPTKQSPIGEFTAPVTEYQRLIWDRNKIQTEINTLAKQFKNIKEIRDTRIRRPP